MCLDAGCPVALSSDAHVPEHARLGYDRALEVLDDLGVTRARGLRGRAAADGADRMSASHAGIGYDAHRFDGGPAADPRRRRDRARARARRPLRRRRPHPRVIDALLGAAGLGDIGQHFPDTDERWRDADSIELLREVVALLAEAGCEPRQRRRDRRPGAPEGRPLPRRDPRALAGALGLAPSA